MTFDRRWTPLAGAVLVAALALSGCLLSGCSTSSNPVAPTYPPLSAVVISPVTDTLQVGERRQFSAQAYDTLGALVGGVVFTWRASDRTVLTVGPTGAATARAEGASYVIAEVGGRSDSARVFVYPDTGWIVQTNPSGGTPLNGVHFLPDGRNGWVVGDGGRTMRTSDAGLNWQVVAGGTVFNLNAVWTTAIDQAWAAGNGGTMMQFDGVSWSRDTSVHATENLYDVCFLTPDTGWTVGSSGVTLRTVNGGQTWKKVYAATGFSLRSVSFAGSQNGWAVGDNGTIAGTHDGGATWFVVPSLTGQNLRAVWRVDASHAVAVGTGGTVLRTVVTPDSIAWELVVPSAGSDNGLEGVCFPSAATGYAVGSNALTGASALRSDDGAVTWTAQVPKTSVTLRDVFFVDALRGWAVGDGGTIVHTAHGGH
jgi:photosystem II stability/assembly factor-like uncharacterized protein